MNPDLLDQFLALGDDVDYENWLLQEVGRYQANLISQPHQLFYEVVVEAATMDVNIEFTRTLRAQTRLHSMWLNPEYLASQDLHALGWRVILRGTELVFVNLATTINSSTINIQPNYNYCAPVA